MDIFKDKMSFEKDFSIFNLKDIGIKSPYQSVTFNPMKFGFMFVKNAFGYTIIDEIKYEIFPHQIRFTNMHRKRFLILEDQEDIFIILFEELFLKKYVSRNYYKEFSFLLLDTMVEVNASEKAFAIIENIYLQIYNEYNSENCNYFIMGHYLAILLERFKEILQDNGSIKKEDSDFLNKIVVDFKIKLNRNFQELIDKKTDIVLKNKDYSELFNLHPNYLNRIIKLKTGKTITNWINEKMIEEAKIVLKEDKLSIKEIANLFCYSESTHFSHFFKSQTGYSPSEYRKISS